VPGTARRGLGTKDTSPRTVDRDVAFTDVEDSEGLEERIDAAYRAKYARYSGPVASITAAEARATTMRLTPQ
jgi:hypothetical protein